MGTVLLRWASAVAVGQAGLHSGEVVFDPLIPVTDRRTVGLVQPTSDIWCRQLLKLTPNPGFGRCCALGWGLFAGFVGLSSVEQNPDGHDQ